MKPNQTTNLFGYVHDIMIQFEFIHRKSPNLTTLHVHLYCFQIIHIMKQYTKCLGINYYDTNDLSGYFQSLNFLVTSRKLVRTNILQDSSKLERTMMLSCHTTDSPGRESKKNKQISEHYNSFHINRTGFFV